MNFFKSLFKIIKNTLRSFVINPFWKSPTVLVILGLSLVLNALLWYIFKSKIKVNPTPFFFASGIIGLNLILANYIWNKEKLISIFLLSISLFVQILMLVFIRYLVIVF